MKQEEAWNNRKRKKREGVTPTELTKTALMTALLCVLSPLTIYLPVSPVGLTFGTLVLYLTGFLLGPRLGAAAVLLYLAIGLFGIPVFSGFTAGAAVLLGPTGGYLSGYVLCTVLVGYFTKKAEKKTLPCFVAGMICGTLVVYLFGTGWFFLVYAKGTTFAEALLQCVVPFLPLDVVKIVIAAVLCGPMKVVRGMV